MGLFLGHKSSTDAAISLLVMTLATLTRVPQDLSLVVPRGIQYVDQLPKHGHCSNLLPRPAAVTHRACAARLVASASESKHAVIVAKLAALVPRVRLPTHLLSLPS